MAEGIKSVTSSDRERMMHLMLSLTLLAYIAVRVWIYWDVCTWSQIADELSHWLAIVSLGAWRF